MNNLLKKIVQMCEERKQAQWKIYNAQWDASKEHQLICLIKEAERQGIKPQKHQEWDSVLRPSENYSWMIQTNDTEYGGQGNYNAPHSTGKTPLQALKNAWKVWSVPPILIMNAEYHIKGISISDIL